jgi:glycosyltransferase involved in cell wall biosynthesis
MEPYMRGDFDYLQTIADVEWMNSRIGPGWRRILGPTGWIPSGSMLRLVRKSDLVFQWFATPAAPVLAARMARKPSIVIAGGYDVACVPEIGYGLMLGRRTRLMGQLTLQLASRVLCVSQSTLSEAKRWAPRARLTCVPHGLDPARYPQGTNDRRQVVTVGAVSREYLRRKGLDTFAEVSRLVPEVPFFLVGRIVEEEAASLLRTLGGPNLRLTGYLPDEELYEFLRQSAVYAQLSRHEGFGYALAEAMLSGCSPVATSVGALPDVIGRTGPLAAADRPKDCAEAVRHALQNPVRMAGRSRVLREFPLQSRRDRLRTEIEVLLASAPVGDSPP